MRTPFTFGMEEEYLLVDLDTGQVIARPKAAVIQRCREVIGPTFSEELLRSQIEVSSPIFVELAEASEFFQTTRQCLIKVLAADGIALYCAGSHPMARWSNQQVSAPGHYQQLALDYRQVAQRSLVNGLHIHVGISDVDRMQLINRRLLQWLPLLQVLSTSSPFWCGKHSGYMSYRRISYREWPNADMPEPLDNWLAYQRYEAFFQRWDDQRDHLRWLIRPSRHFPTLELRICDACPRLEDGLCIAGLFRHLVEQCARRPLPAGPNPPELRWATQENLWRAARFGSHGDFIVPGEQDTLDAHGWLGLLQTQYPADTDDSERAFAHAHRIIDQGTSAHHQLDAYKQAKAQDLSDAQALRAVVEQVLAQTRV
ncbi:carboxylate-amine ligase [Pseudomonas putida]|uniref:Putative glutamate--cysteine ligase 2 n=1 Tax=Pseudomonas putida TaxID=303 RepID=A0A4D6XCW1_PSEPU|nr:carboxylate-amine ligase [Pseudomonas putida]QCI12518.1 carboxylate-amine ligase [Pseudomonas putida]